MNYEFLIGTEYISRDGREIKIFMTDGGGQSPIIGAWKDTSSLKGPIWQTCRWDERGLKGSMNCDLDIMIPHLPSMEGIIEHRECMTKSGSVQLKCGCTINRSLFRKEGKPLDPITYADITLGCPEDRCYKTELIEWRR